VSNTILEAMATGLPVVATNVGGNAELVKNGETGFIVPAEDVIVMCQTIQRYIDEPELRQDHGKSGRTRVENEFSMSSMVRSYSEVYDSRRGSMESTVNSVREQ
jgi:glycosyltransferase involved in cell wall biosynthesis